MRIARIRPDVLLDESSRITKRQSGATFQKTLHVSTPRMAWINSASVICFIRCSVNLGREVAGRLLLCLRAFRNALDRAIELLILQGAHERREPGRRHNPAPL